MWTRTEAPPDIRARIAADVAAAMKDNDVVMRLKGLGMTPIGSTPDDLRSFHATEQAKWATLPASIRDQR